MFYLCFVFLSVVSSVFCAKQQGGVCVIPLNSTSVAGKCISLAKCGYARKILYEDQKKPPTCWWEVDNRVACCPLNDIYFKTGIYGRFYDPVSDGIKRSSNLICHYDGFQHLCCPLKPDPPTPSEEGCPKLVVPPQPSNLNPAERIAWRKCIENQRFVKQCVARKNDRRRFERKHVCYIPIEQDRISGGREAYKYEFPHMAVLGVMETNEEKLSEDVVWIGGGTLISDRFILTAAHVLIDPEGRPLRYALLGTLDKTDILQGLLYNIVRKIQYPTYDYNRLHDIALVELNTRVPFSSFVRPACLPVPGFQMPNSLRTIAGWGQTYTSITSQILLTTDVHIQAHHSECATKFETNRFHFNSSMMICAKGKIRNQVHSDSCHGDSGGPLMALLENVPCSYAVEGVVSFGPTCGEGSAGVYTRVSHYLDWIVKTVWADEYDELQNSK